MNLKDLEYFQRLVKERNYTKVAEAFKVSQPTVTYAVKRLEEIFGTKLIYRDQSHKQLTITPAGQILSQHISTILHELYVASTEINRLKDEKIAFGLPPIIGNYYFPKLSTQLFEHDLMTQINLVDAGSIDLITMLQRGKIDLALLGSISPIRDQQLDSHLLVEKNFMIIVSPQHRLAQRKSVSFAELKAENFVILNEHYVHPKAFKMMAQQAGFEPTIIYQNNNLNILKGMIREQVGIGFLTEIAVNKEDHLVCLPIEDTPQPHFLISLVQRDTAASSSIREELIELINQLAL